MVAVVGKMCKGLGIQTPNVKSPEIKAITLGLRLSFENNLID